MKVDEIVSLYIALRDEKAAMEKAHKDALKPIEEAMEAAEQAMLAKLNRLGVNSLRTTHGTVGKTVKTSVTVADWDIALKFVQDNDLWHFLEHRIGKAAVEGYIEENGEPPPGVNVSRFATVSFRRS